MPKSKTIFVKPASGGLVRRPEASMTPIPAEGCSVPDNPYYNRLIIQGALFRTKKPKKAPAKTQSDNKS